MEEVKKTVHTAIGEWRKNFKDPQGEILVKRLEDLESIFDVFVDTFDTEIPEKLQQRLIAASLDLTKGTPDLFFDLFIPFYSFIFNVPVFIYRRIARGCRTITHSLQGALWSHRPTHSTPTQTLYGKRQAIFFH